MCRRARVLSAALLAGAVLGAAVPAAYAEPAAEVSPHTVAPGDTVTISVSCDPTGGPDTETIDAGSQAFEQGTVQLQRVPGDDDSAGGPSYQGTAQIAPAADFETGPDAAGGSTEWGVDGSCPAAPGGEGAQWSAAFTVTLGGDPNHAPPEPTHDALHEPMQDAPHEPTHDALHEPAQDAPHEPTDHAPHESAHDAPHEPMHEPTHDDTHHPAPVQRGVNAGGGGAFTDSVPAMVAGGLLIAGALCAAAHRLLHRRGRWTP